MQKVLAEASSLAKKSLSGQVEENHWQPISGACDKCIHLIDLSMKNICLILVAQHVMCLSQKKKPHISFQILIFETKYYITHAPELIYSGFDHQAVCYTINCRSSDKQV